MRWDSLRRIDRENDRRDLEAAAHRDALARAARMAAEAEEVCEACEGTGTVLVGVCDVHGVSANCPCASEELVPCECVS